VLVVGTVAVALFLLLRHFRRGGRERKDHS
jgi:hypothetical protein